MFLITMRTHHTTEDMAPAQPTWRGNIASATTRSFSAGATEARKSAGLSSIYAAVPYPGRAYRLRCGRCRPWAKGRPRRHGEYSSSRSARECAVAGGAIERLEVLQGQRMGDQEKNWREGCWLVSSAIEAEGYGHRPFLFGSIHTFGCLFARRFRDSESSFMVETFPNVHHDVLLTTRFWKRFTLPLS